MKQMTEESLQEAFAGESMAHMKYKIFSDVAKKEGFQNIARLFQAISYAEQVHATNHARHLGRMKKTEENLQTGINGETYEVDEMYPSFMAIAQLQGEKGAQLSFHYALEAEKIHADMYKDAKDQAAEGKDIDIPEVYICPVCGYTHIGTPAEKCPVCNIPSSRFKSF